MVISVSDLRIPLQLTLLPCNFTPAHVAAAVNTDPYSGPGRQWMICLVNGSYKGAPAGTGTVKHQRRYHIDGRAFSRFLWS